jgi:F-type H+-transporting ATPase subunit gamma
MSGRLAEIETRMNSVQQLSQVIAAMRGLAAARTAEANRHLESVRTFAATVATGICEALLLTLPEPKSAPSTAATGKRHLVVAIAAEQGFAGSFSRRILDQVRVVEAATQRQSIELLLIGDRGLLSAREADMTVGWSTPMISAIEQATDLSNRIMDTLSEKLTGGDGGRVTLIHATPGTIVSLNIVEKQLLPFDFARFPPAPGNRTPLVNLPPDTLLQALSREYIFAELCEAVILSFAAENEARMQAMVAAQENISRTQEELVAEARRQRQEDITSEIGELSGSILSR